MRFSLVVFIRTIRPDAILLGALSLPIYRTLRMFLTPDWEKDETILDITLAILDQWKHSWDRIIDVSPGSGAFPLFFTNTISLLFQLLRDIFGILIIVGLSRIAYCLYHFSWHDSTIALEHSIFEWAKHRIPAISKYIQDETDKMIPDMARSFGRDCLKEQKQLMIPAKGRSAEAILQELSGYAKKENATWAVGKMSGTVYTSDASHIRLMNEVYGLYSFANVLHAGVWPKLSQCENELIAMTSDLLRNKSGIGCTTSGGTESVMLAIKAHWIYYGKKRGIRYPELICGNTVHASVDKACEIFGIRKVTLDCSNSSHRLCPRQVDRHITSNTIMIVASAPNYPQGTIDPIQDLGKLAQKYNIGLHVDSCLGGFVLPFAPQGTFPPFDFSVPGVTSMSADPHKFGYAPKGTSIVLYRDLALRHAQYFSYARWTGGLYATPTFAGSRPSSLVGCAWASVVSIGRAGFCQRSKQILDASRLIRDKVVEEIPDLFVLGHSPKEQQQPTMVVCFGSDSIDIYQVADAMKSRGWALSSLQKPPCVHICITLTVAPNAVDLVEDLKQAVKEVKHKDPLKSKKGTAGIYGMTGSLPDGPVNDFLKVFLDVGLRP